MVGNQNFLYRDYSQVFGYQNSAGSNVALGPAHAEYGLMIFGYSNTISGPATNGGSNTLSQGNYFGAQNTLSSSSCNNVFGTGVVSAGLTNSTVIGYSISLTGTNNVIVQSGSIAAKNYGGISNEIHIGDATHTGAISLGPVLFNKPSITGSRGGNAALADLLTKLAAMNLIVDTTTA